jgi:hypothetical protein
MLKRKGKVNWRPGISSRFGDARLKQIKDDSEWCAQRARTLNWGVTIATFSQPQYYIINKVLIM